jgi:Rad3-related DNA helicase
MLLTNNFEFRESPAYIKAIGEIIYGIASNVPQGMLVFFASYAQMNKFLNAWKVLLSVEFER